MNASATASPLVSVIIPFWNAELYLSATIESVWAQTFTDFELVLVNDGSTDGSTEIARREREQRPEQVIVIEKAHSGLIETRYAGLEVARGEWIAWLDSDDLWLPTKLETQVAASRESGSLIISALSENFWSEDVPLQARHALALNEPAPFGASATMIHRSVFDLIPNTVAKGWRGEWIDWMMHVREAEIPTYVLPELLVRRRVHATNNSRGGNDDRLRALKAALDRRRIGH